MTQNPAVRELDLGKVFGRGYWANVSESGRNFGKGGDLYRPLTTLSIALSYQLFGTEPLGYHLENILYHGANTACARIPLASEPSEDHLKRMMEESSDAILSLEVTSLS